MYDDSEEDDSQMAAIGNDGEREDEEGAENQMQDTVTIDDIIAMDPNLENCMLLNKVYQELVTDTINRLQTVLEENRQQQLCIREGLDTVMNGTHDKNSAYYPKKYKHLTVFAQPYFRKNDYVQNANEDTKLKLQNKEIDPYIRPPKKWSFKEKEILQIAVKTSASVYLLDPLMARKNDLIGKLKEATSSEEKEIITEKLNELTERIKNTTILSGEELVVQCKEKIDWLKISKIDFEGKRTSIECKLMWDNFAQYGINRGRWTQTEDQELRNAVNIYKSDWEAVATALNTRRTALQCLERYQSNFNESLTKISWTPEEDAALKEIVKSCKIGDFIPWHQVAYYMDGRTKKQIFIRWINTLDPLLKHGKWTLLEDLLLVTLVTKFGQKWEIISKFIKGRNGARCRSRYIKQLDINIINNPWTKVDDKKLISLVLEHGPKWSEFLKYFPGRGGTNLLKRYRRIIDVNKKKESEDPDHCDIVHPKFHPQRAPHLHRLKVYQTIVKKLRIITHSEEYIGNDDDNDNLEDLKRILDSTSSEHLDELIRRFANELKRKNRGSPVSLTNEDNAFAHYFANHYYGTKKVGRHYKTYLAESDPNSVAVAAAMLQALGSELELPEGDSNSVEGPAKCLKASTEQMAVLPPSSSTINAFRLLSFCNRMDQFSAVENFDDTKNKSNTENVFLNYSVQKKTDPQRESWRLLAARFINLFLWPAILSEVEPLCFSKNNQEVEFDNQKSTKNKQNFRAKKRKLKKPWVSAKMKELAKQRWLLRNEEDTQIRSNLDSQVDAVPQSQENNDSAQGELFDNGTQSESVANATQGQPNDDSTQEPVPKRRRGRQPGSKIKKIDHGPPIRSSRRIKPNVSKQES